jgi:hypothetical protein
VPARTLDACDAIVIDRPRLLSIARDCYRSPAIIIDRPQLLSIARDYYRSPATIIDRPQLLSIARDYYRLLADCLRLQSIAVPHQSSQQLINNDNRERVGESACG